MAALPSIPWLVHRQESPWCRTALAQDISLQGAVEAIETQLSSVGEADLALVFASSAYASDLPRLMPLLQRRLSARHWLGCLGGGVIGTKGGNSRPGEAHECEHAPALSVTLLRLPGAELHTFQLDPGELPDLDGPAEPWRQQLGSTVEATRSLLLLVDPGCSAINDLISGLDYAFPQAAKLGGIAVQHSAPHPSLLLGDQVCGGAVGCSIGGSWSLQPVVAQGCRPIGPVLEVEQAQRNVLLQVSRGEQRHSPVAALQQILTGLTPEEREKAQHALFLGVGHQAFPLNPLGGPDPLAENSAPFLVRNLIGVDPRNGAVAVGDRMRVGQKVQFQLRDADASRQESRQLLHRLAKQEPDPLLGLLFACLGRGQGLYGQPDGDVSLCREAFPSLPISGVFCNGEIGPLGGSTHLHGYTASWAFLVADPVAPS
ncbi:MAG: FIST N-terminal domain-containing protein [Cyanobium sp.]|jgi:small ligand-binding sensory domain FIST|nr:FIST N-terminal domain-containing protein [Synechococcaceae cyanobacterium]